MSERVGIRPFVFVFILGSALFAGSSSMAQVWPDTNWMFGSHGYTIEHVTYSLDGMRLASAEEPANLICIWRMPERRLERTLHGKTPAFLPSGDAIAISLGSDAQIWDLVTGALLKTIAGAGSPIDLEVSPDGSTLASASGSSVRIWNVANGSLVRELSGHTAAVSSLAYSPGGTRLISGAGDGKIKVWQLSNGAATTLEHGEQVLAVDYSPDGITLASGGWTTGKLWSASNGALLHTLQNDNDAVQAVCFSPDSSKLAATGFVKEFFIWGVNIWNVATGTLIDTFETAGGPHRVVSLSYSPDGLTLAGASTVESLFLGTLLGAVYLWDQNGSSSLLGVWIGRTSSVAVSPSGDYIAIGGESLSDESAGRAVLLRASDGAQVAVLDGSNFFNGLAISPDGSKSALGGAAEGAPTSWVTLSSLPSGTFLREIDLGQTLPRDVAFSPSSAMVACGTYHNTKVFRVSDGALLRSIPAASALVRFSMDNQFVIGAAGTSIRVWRISDGMLVHTISAGGAVNSIATSPNGQTLAGSAGATIKIWNLSNGTLVRELPGHTGGVTTLSYFDAERLVSTGADRTIRSWSASTGVLLRTQDQETGSGLTCLAASGSGGTFAYGRDDSCFVFANTPVLGQAVLPHNLNIFRGRLVSGGLPELLQSDNLRLVVGPGPVFTNAQSPIHIIIDGTAPSDSLSELRFTLEGHTTSTNIEQRIELYNFLTSGYETVDLHPSTTSDSISQVSITDNPQRFVQSGTRLMRTRMRYKANGPIFVYPWAARLDHTYWTVFP